jgi:hypothetical protein
MQKVKVSRYIAGQKPKYAKDDDDDRDSSTNSEEEDEEIRASPSQPQPIIKANGKTKHIFNFYDFN